MNLPSTEAANAPKTAQAPDKAKLAAFATAVRALPVPVVTDQLLHNTLLAQVAKFAEWIDAEGGSL